MVETTALGAAYLAGLSTGIYADTRVIGHQWRIERTFEPQISRDEAASRMVQWERAVRQTCAR